MTPTQGFLALSCYTLAYGLTIIAVFAWPRKDKP